MKQSVPLLRTSQLAIGWDPNTVIGSIDLTLDYGHKLVITGSNGVGKTTLLMTLLGIIPSLGGTIEWFGTNLKEPKFSNIRPSIGYCGQLALESDLPLTAQEVVAIGTYHQKSLNKKAKHNIIVSALELVGCVSLIKKPYQQLSGGQKQRIQLARALAQKPQVLVLDEPAASQDPDHKLSIITLLDSLSSGFNQAIIMTSHETQHFTLTGWTRYHMSGTQS
jgi:ABC-type Mn2+/Zn2+ transport system ATPase subunit